MYIKIENDMFDICKRIKEIDEDYYVLFNVKKGKFEIHNRGQLNSYCLTVENDTLDSRVIDLILRTKIEHIDKIIDEIDNMNEVIEKNEIKKIKNDSDYMVREIYDFCNNSSKNFEVNSFDNLWS